MGQTLTLKGSYFNWDTKALAEEFKDVDYACVIASFSAVHKWTELTNQPPSAAFELQDPAKQPDGSHSSFWMQYPLPFLEHWHKSQPVSGSDSEHDEDANDGEGPVHPDDGSRCQSGVYQFLSFLREEKVVSGRMAGAPRRVYKCTAKKEGGKICGHEVSIINKGTSNTMYHFRTKASAGCDAHADALAAIEETNSKSVTVDGEVVPVLNFKESFPHHCDFYWMVADGCPQEFKKKDSFKEYVRGYEPRAVQPHHITIKRIGTCIDELQDEMQEKHIKQYCDDFDGEPCCGIQLDLWQCDDTHVTYGALNLTRALEEQDQIHLESEVLEFEEFPYTTHTAENIASWITDTLAKKKLPLKVVSGITPDGAADGIAAINSIAELVDLLDKCILHQLNRVLLYALGLTGRPCKNDDGRGVIKENRKIPALSNQSRHVNDMIIKIQRKAGVPEHKSLATVDTCPTRWGNQFDQVEGNIILRPMIESAITKHKLAIGASAQQQSKVVVHGCGDDNRIAKEETSIADIDMSEEMWQATLEIKGAMHTEAICHRSDC